MLRRKIDKYLLEWKQNENKNPLIIYGARQIGKTTSIEEFGKNNYESLIVINFISNPEYKEAFSSFDPEIIVKNLTTINPKFKFIENKTLIFFDEIQQYMDATTSLKFFKLQGKYDVICSGSALGVTNKTVSSVSVGFKDEYIMHSLDFEEFLWALGYNEEFVNDLLNKMVNKEPLDNLTYKIMSEQFYDYIILGGFPRIVQTFIDNKNFSNILNMQKRIYKDYEDDLSKYLDGIDIVRAQRVYKSITPQLAKDNHKFQFSKLGHGARFMAYYGVAEWIKNAGIALICNNVELELPLKGNEEIDNFRMYYGDLALLIASLDDETQRDLRVNKNLGVYKGAIYENILADSLNKQGYDLYFYRSEDSTQELDFIIRYKDEILPLEVKAKNGRTKSLRTLIEENKYISNGIKFGFMNIGEEDNITSFPIFLSFLLKRYLERIR